jgi:small-conductance mechanosensitive channel
MEILNLLLGKLLAVLHFTLFAAGKNSFTVWTTLYLVGTSAALWILTGKARTWLVGKVLAPQNLELSMRERLGTVFRCLLFFVGITFVLDVSELDVTATQIIAYADTLMDVPFVHIGKTKVTLWTIIYVLGLWTALIIATNRLQNWVTGRLLSGSTMDLGAVILKYIVVSLGFIVILQSAGVDLSTLTVLAGALGLGLSFGLQNITSNLVSGLIVLFERPVKVGDRIDVGGVTGDVKGIALRATTICTNDNIEIIVPNSEFISSNVVNWSHSNRDVRVSIPVGVSYNSDPELVKETLLEAARQHVGVLAYPEPVVLFDGFGDSSLDFILRAFTRDYVTQTGVLRSDLNFTIFKKFKERGVEIPFPQRDIHIRSGTLPASVNDAVPHPTPLPASPVSVAR